MCLTRASRRYGDRSQSEEMAPQVSQDRWISISETCRVPTDHQAPSQEVVTTATTRNLGGSARAEAEDEQELEKHGMTDGVELVLSRLFRWRMGRMERRAGQLAQCAPYRNGSSGWRPRTRSRTSGDWGGEIDKHVADDVIKLHTEYHVPAPAASYAASAPVMEYIVLSLSLWWSTSHQPRLRPRLTTYLHQSVSTCRLHQVCT